MGSLINQAIENNKDDFKILKKHYGERFAKHCRTLFPTILEEKGALSNLILSKFAPSKFLYEDIVNNYASERFKNFIHGLYIKESEEHHEIEETPEQLFEKAGYTLYKCETDEDVHKFEKYFKHDEKLCTFKDSNRINTHTIFFAVKKNVDEIKRENFSKPRRQDEYGTSVISLQFTKGKHSTLSIKNRYNHTVDNPDATFSNDLENIYPGLTDSFQKYYDINLVSGKHNFELPSYVMAKDGKYYRYNHEIDNVYYCSNNIIITNSEPQYLDSRRYDLIEYFIIDKQEKTLTQAPNMSFDDGFVEDFKDFKTDISNITKIETSKQGEEKTFIFTLKGEQKIKIVVNKYNEIIEYHNPNMKIIPRGFLRKNVELKELDVPNATQICDLALNSNNSIEILNLPSVVVIQNEVMPNDACLQEINCPKLYHLGNGSFRNILKVKNLIFESLEEIEGNNFMETVCLEEFIAPLLINMGNFCLRNTKNLTNLNVESLEHMGLRCLQYASKLTKFIAPNLITMKSFCLSDAENVDEVDLSSLEETEQYCFNANYDLTELNLPNLYKLGMGCFQHNTKLVRVNLPNLEDLYVDCFEKAINLEEFNAPKITLPSYISEKIKLNNNPNRYKETTENLTN